LTLGHAGWQHACVRLAAARAVPAVEPVFIDLCAHGRHLEDLMALRCIGQFDLAAALAHHLGLAVHHAVDFTFVEHGPGVPLVAGLGAALAIAGPALSPVHLARAVGRWRLRRVVGVQVDPFLQQLHPFQQLRNDGVALRNRLR